ncbi:MAG: hypothetical protein ACI8UP_001925 [Porticoccaceae bacterium]
MMLSRLKRKCLNPMTRRDRARQIIVTIEVIETTVAVVMRVAVRVVVKAEAANNEFATRSNSFSG